MGGRQASGWPRVDNQYILFTKQLLCENGCTFNKGRAMNQPFIQRRRLAQWAVGAAALQAMGLRAQPAKVPFLADMHSHYGMFLPRLFGFDLKKHMQESGISLLAWAVVDDQRWISSTPRGLKQGGVPKEGELWAYFQARMVGYQTQLQSWGVAKALTAADVADAIGGQPRVLLATEAANFLEGDVTRLGLAHGMGVRHVQLVHYIQSPLGDHQTAEPTHGGLTPLGAKVVAECQRLGMVVDLAHGTAALVDAALDAATNPMVWSHSWINPQGGTHNDVGWVARSLSLATAKKIAAKGGAVGLWNLKLRMEPGYQVDSINGYANEIMRMCDLIGPDHVAFGTDMEGVWPSRLMTGYDDLREVANKLAQRGLSETQLSNVFLGNYARIVQHAMNGART
jgi:membrane dipeptidase